MSRKYQTILICLLFTCTALLIFPGCDTADDDLNDVILTEYTLTMEEPDGEGEVKPQVGTHTYNEDEIVDLKATPDSEYLFSHWVGDVADRYSKTTTTMMNAHKTVQAVFYHEDADPPAIQFTLTVKEPDGEGDTDPPVGEHSFQKDEVVDLQALPKTGWLFSHWEGDVDNTESASTNITIDEDKTIKAFFLEEGERTVVPISSNIDSPETWSGDAIYVIESRIRINAILTIEPGAIIKFEEGRRMTVTSSGGLLAQGTAEQPIIFTSIKDDEHGGDTNEDGDLTTPAPGDWEYVHNDGGTAIFNYCEFYYGGYRYIDCVLYTDGDTTVKNSTFAHNKGRDYGALYAVSRTTIENNVFYKNKKPLRMNPSLDLDDSNIFHNPANPEQVNTFQGIFIHDSRVDRSPTWEETEVPFVLTSNLTIGEGYHLTLEEGVIVKFDDSRLTIDGRLTAAGEEENPIVFTSYKDDEHGGDSNGDGDFTSPAPEDWEHITINGNATFDYCEFYYGGGRYLDYTLHIDGPTTVTNCTFAYNYGRDYGALYAESGATIENSFFYKNVKPLQINPSLDLDDSNIFHNPANPEQVNTFQGIFIRGNRVSRSSTWEETEAPFVLTSNLTIGEGYHLTLEEGVIVKFDDSRLTIDGRLTAVGVAENPIIFTSYKDDEHGGNSNNDTATPAAEDWEYITINGNATFDYCKFYYGGGRYLDYTLHIDGPTTVTNCTFAYNHGIDYGALYAESEATIENNIFYSNKKPLLLNISLDLDDSNIFHNPEDPEERNTFEGIFIAGTSLSNDVTWEETEIAYVIQSTFTIPEEHRITLGENVILKFTSGTRLSHNNNLHGYDGMGVHFTSYKDHERGGDSDGQGTATQPEIGDWTGIRNTAASPRYYESWDNIHYAAEPSD